MRRVSPNGKVTPQNIGYKTLGSFPRIIAEQLNLPNADKFTGHSFRRTGATLLAESGCSIIQLKNAGNWNSPYIAEGYVAHSMNSKSDIAKRFSLNADNCKINNNNTSSSSSIATSGGYSDNSLTLGNMDFRNSRNVTVNVVFHSNEQASKKLKYTDVSSEKSGI